MSGRNSHLTMPKRFYSETEGNSDHELLERFLREQNAQAFAALVERHGPMILGVCRRMLRDAADADDAFQATFLMLLRKAHTIRRKTALPSWLYRVAVRVALRRLRQTQNRALLPLPADLAVASSPADEVAWREAAEVIDTELQNLPENYRAPLLLCCIEGRSYEEAAEMLGCPVGTVGIRLLRARERLRKRLVQRGLMLGASFVAARVIWPQAQASVPPELAANTLAAVKTLLSGHPSGGAIKPQVWRLMEGNGRWWQFAARVPLLTLVLGGVSILVGIFVGVTYESSPYRKAGAQTSGGITNPIVASSNPSSNSLRRPAPGLWVARSNGGQVTWRNTGATGHAPGAAEAAGEIVEIAIITDNLRYVPERNSHEGALYLKGFSLFNSLLGI
jgi:RNA polymerase sigma factor (sigma-70 family)